MQEKGHPKARHEGLVIRELPDELLVYDTETHEAHCLNDTAAFVWKHCDGETSVPEIATALSGEFKTKIEDEVVWMSLEDLWKRQLLVGEPAPEDEKTMSRSTLLRRTALIGAAVAVPTVASVVAPRAAQAASCIPSGQACTSGTTCCPNTPCPGGGVCP
jgi:hypothetical protein